MSLPDPPTNSPPATIVPEKLQEVMRQTSERLTGLRVRDLVRLPGGASLRRYYRALLDGSPSSLIVMELGESPVSEEAGKGEAATRLPFIDVLEYLKGGGVAVPALHFFDERAGLLYLEDLGDDTLESRVVAADDTVRRRYYNLAIAELVRMQRHAEAHPAGSIAFERGFDVNLLKWELDHFREWGLEVGAGVVLTEIERTEIERLFSGIAERLAAEPRGLVHRDYQSRNLMVQDGDRGPRIRVIDFQDALLGTRAYDLVALLRDSYVELSPSLLDRLVGDYAAQAEVDAAAFRSLFDLQTVQRKLKDAGRFIYIDRVKKNPLFLPYVDGSHRYVAHALSRLPELAPLREILARHLPAFR